MNMNQQFDEHIRGQFSNYAPDVHPSIWENIMAEKEKIKPVGFWMRFFSNRNRLVLLVSLFAISTAGSLLYMNNRLTASGINTAGEKKNMKAENKNGPDNSVSPGNIISADQPAVEIDLNEDKTTALNNRLPGNNNALSTPGRSKLQLYAPLQPADDGQYNIATNKNSNKKRNTGTGSLININTQSPDLTDDDLAGQGTLLGRLTIDAERVSASNRKINKRTLSFNPIIFLPGCPSTEKNTAGNKRYFEIYGGLDYAFRSMSDTGNSVYLQKRKESTKFRSGFSAGIRYTKVFNNSMSVRAGLNYSQINEKFTFNQGNLVQITYIIDANGDTTGTYITTGTRHKTTFNKYRSIDVPLLFGYEVGNGKLHANINAGVVVNLYSWQKGEVLDASLNPVSITTGKSSSPYQFKTNAGIGFIGGVSVYYKLNDRIHVMAEPYFRYNFTPMNKEGITLKQKYHTAGLRLGIRLDLK